MLTPFKAEKLKHFEEQAPTRDDWKRRSWYYHQEVERLCRSIIPPGRSVLEIGCGTGDLLHALQPSRGVGLDFSPRMVEIASKKYPELDFRVGDAEELALDERFDYVVISDTVGHLEDVWRAFRCLGRVCEGHTRVVVTYYSYLWEPIIRAAERLGLKAPLGPQNWLPVPDLEGLLALSGFEVVKTGARVLVPVWVPVVSSLANWLLAALPGVRSLCLVRFLVARPGASATRVAHPYTCSVVVPCRNERENISALIARMPRLGPHTEILFVDGESSDGTVEVIQEMMETHRDRWDIRLIRQVPATGKGDAVRRGFAASRGDVLIILDADLSVAPDDLTKFYLAIAEQRGEFINGSRLVYPMEGQAMRFLNLLGNKGFSVLFTWLLEQPIRDTLCGTKALLRRDYERIAANRVLFGEFDPFGDFDLLFGAAKLTLKIVEVPVRYRERVYGSTKIRRFYHGWLLLRMFLRAVRRLRLC